MTYERYGTRNSVHIRTMVEFLENTMLAAILPYQTFSLWACSDVLVPRAGCDLYLLSVAVMKLGNWYYGLWQCSGVQMLSAMRSKACLLLHKRSIIYKNAIHVLGNERGHWTVFLWRTISYSRTKPNHQINFYKF